MSSSYYKLFSWDDDSTKTTPLCLKLFFYHYFQNNPKSLLLLLIIVLTGSDVIIVQNLIARQKGVIVSMTQQYDPQTAQAVKIFQQSHKLPVTGDVDPSTASGTVVPS